MCVNVINLCIETRAFSRDGLHSFCEAFKQKTKLQREEWEMKEKRKGRGKERVKQKIRQGKGKDRKGMGKRKCKGKCPHLHNLPYPPHLHIKKQLDGSAVWSISTEGMFLKSNLLKYNRSLCVLKIV